MTYSKTNAIIANKNNIGSALKMGKVYLAIDLGAGSGRVMAAVFDGKKLSLEEVSRWESRPVKIGGSFHWDVDAIFASILGGLRAAKARYGDSIVSLGIDTWGVDYGLLDASDRLVSMPYIYRDSRTEGMEEEVFAKIPRGEIYARTGIQFMFFNTIFQLAADARAGAFERAETFLMMPDLIAFMLCGVKANERTNASTTQCYNPFKRDWDWGILEKIGAPERLFKSGFAECGTCLGLLRPDLRAEFGDIKVACVATHDTASAVVATPSAERNPAYVNSGTWSLAGLELDSPIANAESLSENFTNEIGAENTVRFLKNITGMWLVQKCRESWKREEFDADFRELEREAAIAEPGRTVFDVDSPEFSMPDDMPSAIVSHCRERSLAVPRTRGEMFRAIQESIAAKYAGVFGGMRKISGVDFGRICIMGGGSKDAMLNQFAADATGCEISAGPTESTAFGNAIMQMKASGDISSVRDGREIVLASCRPEIFEPSASRA